jgi:hypothetical protein
MEVHRINCCGKDPFISTGTDLYFRYLPQKPTLNSLSISEIKKVQVPKLIEIELKPLAFKWSRL